MSPIHAVLHQLSAVYRLTYVCYDLSLPASYLLTRKDVFFTKSQFCQIVGAMLHGKDTAVKIDIPPPAIVKVRGGIVCGCGCRWLDTCVGVVNVEREAP